MIDDAAMTKKPHGLLAVPLNATVGTVIAADACGATIDHPAPTVRLVQVPPRLITAIPGNDWVINVRPGRFKLAAIPVILNPVVLTVFANTVILESAFLVNVKLVAVVTSQMVWLEPAFPPIFNALPALNVLALELFDLNSVAVNAWLLQSHVPAVKVQTAFTTLLHKKSSCC
jgi:hypothetical protein